MEQFILTGQNNIAIMKILGLNLLYGRIEYYYDWVSIFNTYKKYIKKNNLVLEIGAASVPRTKDLSQYCKKIIGVELFPDRLPKNFNNIQYIEGDWQNLTKIIKINSIDVCLASHVIEHIPDDLKAINELYKVLKPGGVALINTPNRKRLARAINEFFVGEKKFPFGEHCREYTENDLTTLLKKSYFTKYKIIPVAFGLLGGPLLFYSPHVPKIFRRYANYWEIHLFKNI